MKHLCIDARMCRAGGIGTFLNYMTSHLLKSWPGQLTFLCDNNPSPLYLSVPKVQMNARPFSLKEQWELAAKIPSCDLFWSPFINIPLFPIRAKRRVVTVHDTYHLTYSKTFPYFHRLGSKVFYNGAFFLADCIMTLSEFSREEILKQGVVKPKKVKVVPGGIDGHFFSPCLEKKKLQKIREKYHLPQKFILALGNVKPHKNLSTLLLAFDKLERALPGACGLVIVGKKEGFMTGEKSLFSLLDARPQLKEKVIFTGFTPEEEIPLFYSLAECFCFPSFYEGYGYPPLEAMSCGCPVVASAVASIPEVCKEGALYIDPTDPNDLFQKIRKVLLNKNVRESLIRRGREVALEANIANCGAKFQELLEEVQ